MLIPAVCRPFCFSKEMTYLGLATPTILFRLELTLVARQLYDTLRERGVVTDVKPGSAEEDDVCVVFLGEGRRSRKRRGGGGGPVSM